METLENNTSITNKILGGLKKATVELEEFMVQAALGKAEARDTYEELKKIFDKHLHQSKVSVESIKDLSKEKLTALKTIIENLQVQLALGKAETKDVFETQQAKIVNALNQLEEFIKNNKFANEQYSHLLLEMGKFKIKLDILKMRYELGKLEARIEFKDKKKELAKKIEEIEERLTMKKDTVTNAWGDFTEEISKAYAHFKKTILD